VHIDIVTDYGAEAFILALRRFIAVRGKPIKVWTDQGSQIAAASKEMKDVFRKCNENTVDEFSSQMGIDRAFSDPDAPWQNGCAESLVKSVKKALFTVIGAQELTFTEMQTVLMESASLVNERPIGRHPTDPEDG
jgi:transposase InsO family protein